MEEPRQLRRALIDSLAGAVSGGISRTVTSPLDVIKIRFQVRLCLRVVVKGTRKLLFSWFGSLVMAYAVAHGPLYSLVSDFQVQLEPTSSWALLHRDSYGSSKYTGILQSSKVILREEGLTV
ncbi:hypothetical protein B296_00028663 [Ensete ventricosum]|uniref:ADP,ATP carrier protein n=1 Tax=Ensete ventricosum TaxID=4639 RepID=A0A426YVZ0_ENSVE|nr:hypothetical protein B296_00028663 [Ensete ventricosum]